MDDKEESVELFIRVAYKDWAVAIMEWIPKYELDLISMGREKWLRTTLFSMAESCARAADDDMKRIELEGGDFILDEASEC